MSGPFRRRSGWLAVVALHNARRVQTCRSAEDFAIGGGVDTFGGGRAGVTEQVLDDGEAGTSVEDGAGEVVAGVVRVQRTAESDELWVRGFGFQCQLFDDIPDRPGAEAMAGTSPGPCEAKIQRRVSLLPRASM